MVESTRGQDDAFGKGRALIRRPRFSALSPGLSPGPRLRVLATTCKPLAFFERVNLHLSCFKRYFHENFIYFVLVFLQGRKL